MEIERWEIEGEEDGERGGTNREGRKKSKTAVRQIHSFIPMLFEITKNIFLR